jgi:hypothetical protein
MKMLSASACLSLLFISCNGPVNDAAIKPGAYKMTSQNVKSAKFDTSYNSSQQLKIYTGEYMMYAAFNPMDSGSSFGIGRYDADKDTIMENVIYSAQDTIKNDSKRSYKLIITKTDSGYKQVIPDMPDNGQTFMLTETYSNVGNATKTPLDGVWSELKTFVVKGNDTTKYNTTQYKAYFGGYYIWGHTYNDSVQRNQTGMGFGRFVMVGNDKIKESCITSSYPSLRGQDIDIDVSMNGEDEFKQTINYKDGSRAVEIYQRLKK